MFIARFFLILFFVPETKEMTLEELDAVFDVPLHAHVAYGAKQFGYLWAHHVLRRGVAKPTLPYLLHAPHHHHHRVPSPTSSSVPEKAIVDPMARV